MAHPRIVSRGAALRALQRVRKLCAALPSVVEKEAWGRPTFRAPKMFLMFVDDHHGDGRLALWCLADHDEQEALVTGDPLQYFVPPYVGPSGWVGVRLDRGLDRREVEERITAAFHRAAPKRVLAARGGASPQEPRRPAARKPASRAALRRPARV